VKHPHISLVIPAFNEEKFLTPLLDTVDKARDCYGGGADRIEVIVADNASTDRTAEIARERGCRVATVELRRIAAARNGGAKIACGEVVAFVDADSLIHPETFNVLERTLTEDVIVGATGVTMSRMSLGIGASLAVIYPILYLIGADSGVAFCRKADFDSIGGYDEGLSFAEDIDFFLRIKKLGRTRGQRFTRASGARTVTSARKFDKHGEWHYLTNIAQAPFLLLADRERLKEFVDEYWYDDRA